MAPLNIFIYVQHLSGIGHTVRMQQVGKALAAKHRVTILDGGRKLQFPPGLNTLQVPRIARVNGQLAALDPGVSLPRAMAERSTALASLVESAVPDIILVEHFPFSKWELGEEIHALLAKARIANPALGVIASLRDICPPTRHEDVPDYSDRVLAGLRQFDALLVHGDPALCTLEDYFGQREQISIPVHYTGIVTADAAPLSAAKRQRAGVTGPYVVASVGGGRDAAGLLTRVKGVWRELQARGEMRDHSLLLFGGLGEATERARELPGGPVLNMGFDQAFVHWLAGAALSISCAGYNTCAELLAAGVPALLAPNPEMSDQAERARLLEARGLARVIAPPGREGDPLAQLILSSLAYSPPRHAIDTDGAARSVSCIEAVASGLQAH